MSWDAFILSDLGVWALYCVAAAIGDHGKAIERVARALEGEE